jgi:hypothetical protein
MNSIPAIPKVELHTMVATSFCKGVQDWHHFFHLTASKLNVFDRSLMQMDDIHELRHNFRLDVDISNNGNRCDGQLRRPMERFIQNDLKSFTQVLIAVFVISMLDRQAAVGSVCPRLHGYTMYISIVNLNDVKA